MLSNDTFGLYCFGVELTAKFQHNLIKYEDFLLSFSHLGDPRYAFLMLYPLTFCLDNQLGIKVLWTSAITEWLNAIFKWIVRDDRPYWWHSKHCHVTGKDLKQFPITCESGPGFPSGHVMSTSSLGLLLLIYLFNKFDGKTLKIFLSVTILPLYVAVVVLVSISRVYIAAHFPHQVVVGAFVGVMVASSVHAMASKYPSTAMYQKKSILIGFFLLFTALILYYLLLSFKLNPMSSVTAALSFCKKKEWVHLNTTLFFAVIRDAGSIIGIGLSTILIQNLPNAAGSGGEKGQIRYPAEKWSCAQRFGSIICGVLLCLLFYCTEYIDIPQNNLFYFYAILKYISYSCTVIMVEYLVRTRFLEADEKNKTMYIALFFILALTARHFIYFFKIL